MSQSIESPTHHITAIASDPQWYLDFYTQVLGFRLVKRTVNFDDPGVYILTLNRGDQSRKHRKRRSSANVSGTTSDLTPMTAGSLAPFLVLGAGVGFAGGLVRHRRRAHRHPSLDSRLRTHAARRPPVRLHAAAPSAAD
jgi:catechol 2,3-dioxygenase-like lactoylglutathione lyase family enzyme